MSGVQFARVESYAVCNRAGSTRANADGILGEALREEGRCDHVEKPMKPSIVLGDEQTAKIIREELDTMLLFGKAEIETKDGKKTRKMAKDSPVLAACVFSYPGRSPALTSEWKAWAQVKAEAKKAGQIAPPPPESYKAFKAWQEDVLRFASKKYGDRLRFAVAHFDESHPHLHIYALAKMRPDGVVDLKGLHPGRDAKEAVRKSGKEKGETEKEFASRQMAAYKAAMRGWQDEYQESVGKLHAQARFGPKRRRMSRGEWAAEKDRLREEKGLRTKLAAAEEEVASLKQKEIERAARAAQRLIERAATVAKGVDSVPPHLRGGPKPKGPGG